MTTENHNPPAFPTIEMHPHGLDLTSPGMTLRDYFAAHAPISMQDVCDWLDTYGGECVGPWSPKLVMETMASLRFNYAEAMLEAHRTPTGAQHDN